MATVNIGSLTFTHKGDYASGTTYAKNDVVYYATNGNAYIAKQTTTGNAPTSTAHWGVFAAGSGGIWNAGLSIGSANQVVKVNSGANALEFGDAGGGFQSIQTFTSNGTYTKPTGINKIKVYVTGGGAGGAGAASNNDFGGGGGAGGTAIEVLDATSINTVTVTVGNGGAGVTGDNHGNAGATSSFGSYCSAAGGGLGRHGNAGYVFGGAGGAASGGDINITGGAGMAGDDSDNNHFAGGTGGASFWTGGGRGATGSASYGGTNGNFGSGGGGGANNNTSRQAGNGFVLVEEYK